MAGIALPTDYASGYKGFWATVDFERPAPGLPPVALVCPVDADYNQYYAPGDPLRTVTSRVWAVEYADDGTPGTPLVLAAADTVGGCLARLPNGRVQAFYIRENTASDFDLVHRERTASGTWSNESLIIDGWYGMKGSLVHELGQFVAAVGHPSGMMVVALRRGRPTVSDVDKLYLIVGSSDGLGVWSWSTPRVIRNSSLLQGIFVEGTGALHFGDSELWDRLTPSGGLEIRADPYWGEPGFPVDDGRALSFNYRQGLGVLMRAHLKTTNPPPFTQYFKTLTWQSEIYRISANGYYWEAIESAVPADGTYAELNGWVESPVTSTGLVDWGQGTAKLRARDDARFEFFFPVSGTGDLEFRTLVSPFAARPRSWAS